MYQSISSKPVYVIMSLDSLHIHKKNQQQGFSPTFQANRMVTTT